MRHRVSAPTLKDAFEMQLRVIYALMMREVQTRFGRDNIGYLWAVLQPLLFVGVLVAFRMLFMRGTPHGMPLVPFLVTALLSFIAFTQTNTMTMNATRAGRNLLMLPGVTPLDLMLARVALQIPTTVFVFFCADVLMMSIGWSEGADRPLVTGAVLVLAVLLGFGTGSVFSVISEIIPWFTRVVDILLRPLFFISGLFFTAGEIPEPYRTWLLWNPLLHITEMARSAYFSSFESPYASPEYVLTWASVSIVLGMLLERTLRPYMATQ